MGLAKRQLEEDWERGWSSGGDKFVCDAHVEDDALAQLIEETAESVTCSYCSRVEDAPFAAPIDQIIQRIAEGLQEEWGNADDEGVAWDGGYAGATYNSWELLEDESVLNDQVLFADVHAALPEHAWAQRDYYRLRPHLRMLLGWDDFGKIVKHRRRYFFADYAALDDEHDPDFMAPGAMLEAIGKAIHEAGLIRQIPAGTTIWRVRSHDADEKPTSAAELGAPPAHLVTSSGRMSPAGVPLFYGALDDKTAVAEAKHANPKAEAYTLAKFKLRRPAWCVGLAEPPGVPSLFDTDGQRRLRQPMMFLYKFAESISQPFEGDDRVHIEYVPTQVVTEWLRTRFDSGPGRPLDAITYGSARRPTGTNLAMFIDGSGACDRERLDDNALLELVRHARVR